MHLVRDKTSSVALTCAFDHHGFKTPIPQGNPVFQLKGVQTFNGQYLNCEGRWTALQVVVADGRRARGSRRESMRGRSLAEDRLHV